MSRSMASISSGVGSGQDEEHIGDALKLATALLQRHDRVVEARLGRVGGNGVDLGAMRGQRLVEGRAEMLRLDLRERRQLEGAGPVGKQRILDV